jgi:hypothetical protein
MIDTEPVPPVDDDELLARFIVNRNEFRPSDNTVKPGLFLPYRHVDLSVNRHRDCDVGELWQLGSAVAQSRERTLYGRADIEACKCRIGSLDVVQKPLADNPNHADITGYPAAKEDQMSLAQKLADSASDRIAPPS